MTSTEGLSDDALLVQYAAGDPQAARLLVERLAPRVLRVTQRLLQDAAEAEDVTQEAMLRLWKIAPRWEPGGAKPSTWLHRVAVNLATDRLRRRRGVDFDEIAEPDDPSPGVVETMIDGERRRALDEALALLPDRQRVAVVLRHLEGMSNPEIGTAMGIGVEAVESLTARGKRRLAELLSGRRDELGYER
ncbi:RNA polymerase sigma factor [Pararhodobacter sp. CCB-MM2]|uniref:RNA polymerase sigma factor n=1 Tax=Pararhodobacter sp. CCB-MM2 TaxID=1786003 RepID=UPI0008338D6F|nr:RNA polymerase sigma factor [Pararhodobacter sp. CCB-MM2]MCA2012518.1 RNA polymerase sigma factor [Cereibacter sphaeroides]